MTILDPISYPIVVGALLLVAYFFINKIRKVEAEWQSLLVEQLVRAGWTNEDISDFVEFHGGRDVDKDLEDHLFIAWKDSISLSSEKKTKNLLRLKRTIEMIAFDKGWEESELKELTSRMLAVLDENKEHRDFVKDWRVSAWDYERRTDILGNSEYCQREGSGTND
jgi:hypothetical protein